MAESRLSGETAAAAVKSFSFATVSLPIAWSLLTGSVTSGISGFLTGDLIVVTYMILTITSAKQIPCTAGFGEKSDCKVVYVIQLCSEWYKSRGTRQEQTLQHTA